MSEEFKCKSANGELGCSSEETWLLVDSANILWRSFHTTGELTNGTAWGFLRQVKGLERRLGTSRTVFAFDLGKPLRKTIYPNYKANRSVEPFSYGSKEEEIARTDVRRQIRMLRTEWLYEIGYQNVFAQEGYEADDIIASVCKYSLQDRRAIIVSSDKDLYQLLSKDVSIWKPHMKELYTEEDLENELGVQPDQWYAIKSIAGCTSDNIVGVKGIGDKTAAKYLTNGKIRQKQIEDIENFNWKKNVPLVLLPYPDVGQFIVYEDETSVAKWKSFAEKMGMESLMEI